jgi:tryptophanyl-tRNA synthetase
MILAEPGACSPKRRRCPAWTARRCPSRTTTRLRCANPKIGGQEGQEHADRYQPRAPHRPRRPGACPVWQLHQVYSDDAGKEWVQQGCRSAGIGCIECKQPVIDGILREQAPMRERAQVYLDDPMLVKNIIADGCEKARELARETMRDVRESMGLEYH